MINMGKETVRRLKENFSNKIMLKKVKEGIKQARRKNKKADKRG